MNTSRLMKYPLAEKSFENNEIPSPLCSELDARLQLMDATSLVTITDLEGNIMHANDLFCKVSGYGRHELIGKTHSLIRHPDLPANTVEAAMKMLLEGKTWSGIVKNKSKNGGIFWSRTSVAPVMDDNNQPFKLIWMRNDITDVIRTEQELHTAKDRADQRWLENAKNAFRIQEAILPSEKDLQTIFPSAFTLTSPQQIVSGDFYWFDQQKQETIFVLGDGTGHGVSASYVSLIALTALEFIVKQNKETDPGKILCQLNDFLFRALNKHKGSGLFESADMSICSYNSKTRVLKYASGKSKIYLVRDEEVHILDRDEFSIGSQDIDCFKMNSKTIFLEKGDRIFMMSDGICDQLGGDRNKRIGSKKVREILKQTANQPVVEQKEQIMEFFLNWKGENEQTDDVSLMAFIVS